MTPEELAKTKVELTINLNYMCDMHKCQNKVQIVMITTDLIEWQLCASCYEKYLQACANLNAPNTVLHADEFCQCPVAEPSIRRVDVPSKEFCLICGKTRR